MSQYKKCSLKSAKSCFLGTFPILSWLHSYKKDDFVGDLISGCTVAIMHIPQGMGYALLGNLPPVVGIYMAFFPVLLYVIFGTSRHNSMGMKTKNFTFQADVKNPLQELLLLFQSWLESVSTNTQTFNQTSLRIQLTLKFMKLRKDIRRLKLRL